MVSTNIHNLDEASDDTKSPLPNPTTPAQPIDDHNNPIVMSEPADNTAQTTLDHSPPEVPFPDNATPSNDNGDGPCTLANDATRSSSICNSSATSSCDDSDASDSTCENDDSFIENTNPANASILQPEDGPPELGPKPFPRADDFHISHSMPVVVSQMATVPMRPMKQIRPNNKVCLTNPAPKNVLFNDEPQKATIRVLLLCQPTSHPFQTRNIVLEPNKEVKVGRSITRNRVSENNAIFDCKVLSRNHALICMTDGKFYIRDTASSNGTYVNDHRLSLSTTPSKPYEVKTGDIVQFGVDVLENSYKEKHGCIVTMLKFCTGSTDTDELKRCASEEAARSGKVGGTLARSLSSAELYRLNTFIQEAVQREQILETKLLSLQKIIDLSRKNSANVWHSMIEEDRLLSRIDILENKLQYFQKNFTDDKLRKEIIKLQDDKAVYQNSAKEALRKVYQDRNEAVMKLATIERALCSCEDECALLRNQLVKSQTNFKEVTATLTMLEDRDAKLQQQEQVYIQREALTDQKLLDLYEQVKLKTVECLNVKTALDATSKEKQDLVDRIEMYEKMSDRISEEPEDEDDEERHGGPAQATTLLRWLGKMGESGETVEAVLSQRNSKKAISKKNNEQLTAQLNDIDRNLTVLEGIQATLKNEYTSDATTKPTDEDESEPASSETENSPKESNQMTSSPKSDEDQSHNVQDTVAQLKEMYYELRTSLVHTDNVQKDRASELESQLIRCQHEVTSMHLELQSRPNATEMTAKSKECEELRRQVIELATTAQYLQLQLEKPSLVPSPKRSDTHVQTDDPPEPQVTPAAPTIVSSSVFVQTEPSPAEQDLPAAVVQTDNVKPSNGYHLLDKSVQSEVVEPSETTTNNGPVAEEYADDIALLVDPNVRREEELIAFKEQTEKLTESNRRLVHQIELAEKQHSAVSTKSVPIWVVALLVAIIGYLLISSH